MPSAAQSTVSLPVPPCVRHALMSAGLSSVADIRGMSEDALQTVAGLSQQQAADVHQFVAAQPSLGWRLSGATSAAALLQESTEQLALSTTGSFSTNSCTKAPRRISTGSAALDSLLGGGGVDCGTVTEFFGVPGVGKTQIGMQLGVNVQLPPALGGLEGMAIYIDTEGSFITDRLIDMATAAVDRVQAHPSAAPLPAATAATGDQRQQGARVQNISLESLMSGILYFRVQHYTEQLALVRVLDLLLQQQQQVALIVIDSVTFHFRQDFPDAGARARLMSGMAQQLASLAEQRGVAVVMMNQVVTRFVGESASTSCSSGSTGGTSSASWLAPALGEGWGQAASCRAALFWEGSQRYARLTKAKHPPKQQQQQQHVPERQQQLCVAYHVTAAGIS